jgi:hypothetical protein
MAYPILGTPKPAFFDSSGDPLASGTITTLNPSDDAVKASYPTADDANASTNGTSGDITLDSRGEPTSTQYWGKDNEDYKVVIKDSAGTTIYTMDDIRMPAANRRATVSFTSTDATPSVKESKNFILQGSTTITTFHDGEVGDIIHIKAAGGTQTLTIQYSSAVLLAGGKDYIMSNTDTLTLCMFTDQVWTEISRSKTTAGPKFLSADEVISATTTLADVSDLSTWTFAPGTYVAVEGYLKVVSSAVTQDIKFALQTDNAFQEAHWVFWNTNEDGTGTWTANAG